MIRTCLSPLRKIVWFLFLLGFRPWIAEAVVDIPTTQRRAIDVADLASASGIAVPADLSSQPLDDQAYLEASRALRDKGAVDPYGERVEKWSVARRDGRVHLGFLRPALEFRAYEFNGADRRLLLHSGGDVLSEGFNSFLSADGVAFWGDRLGGAYEVQLQASDGDVQYRTKRLYAKTMLGKWSLKVGRDTLHLGPGYHGSLLLDDNAQALDHWSVRSEEPLFLPGRLSGLGGFRVWVFNAYLSDPTPTPPDLRYGSNVNPTKDPRLFGMRVSYHPSDWLDLGLSRAALYGGKGREVYNTPRDWWELFSGTKENVFEGESARYDNDQYGALDVTVRLPFLNGLGPMRAGKLYWEYAGTDLIANWKDTGTGSIVPFILDDVGNLGGIYLSTALTTFRFEYAQTSLAWYRHSQYPQGYTYRGSPLGHHMGGDARDWFFQLSRSFGPGVEALVGFDLEERGRSLPLKERRTEWSFGLAAYRPFSFPATVRFDLLRADVRDALEDPNRRDQKQLYAGIRLTFEP